MKARILPLAFFLMCVASSDARLGESAKEIAIRYGKPLKGSQPTKPASIEGLYTKNGFFIKVGFDGDKALYEIFARSDGGAMVDSEVQKIMESDSANGQWKLISTSPAGEKQWTSPDNKSAAVHDPATHQLLFMTKDFMKRSLVVLAEEKQLQIERARAIGK